MHIGSLRNKRLLFCYGLFGFNRHAVHVTQIVLDVYFNMYLRSNCVRFNVTRIYELMSYLKLKNTFNHIYILYIYYEFKSALLCIYVCMELVIDFGLEILNYVYLVKQHIL